MVATADQHGDQRTRRSSFQLFVWLFGAFLYAIMAALGSQIDDTGSAFLKETVIRFWVCFPIALVLLWIFLEYLPEKLRMDQKKEERISHPDKSKFAVIVFIVLLICWTPMFLFEFPGSFMYDTQRQTFQIATDQYDAFHPLIHTLMLRICLALFPWLQSIEKCAAAYSIWQMLLLAFCFSQVSSSADRMRGRKTGIVTALFFALYPAHMAMACNYIKDVLFSGFFSLFVMLNMEEQEKGLIQKRKILMFTCGVLACLFRNNMIYALAAWCILLSFFRKARKRAVMAVMICICSLTVNEGMIRALHAQRGSIAEMLSVPVQQLSRARLKESEVFTQEEIEQMDSYFQKNGWENYEPTLSDPVKSDLNEIRIKEDLGGFFRLWAAVGVKCPGTYLDAFLNLVLPSIYPYRTYHVAQPYIETGIQNGVITAPFDQPPMTQPGRFETIRNWLYENIYSTGADQIPILKWIMNTGVIYWFLLLCMLQILWNKDFKSFSLALLPLMLYGTYLLGPVMQGRYLYPFICILPAFIMMSAYGLKTQKETGV